jgi:hypothetical protein
MHLAPLGSSAVKHPDAFGAGLSLGGRFSDNQRRIAALQSLFVSYKSSKANNFIRSTVGKLYVQRLGAARL